MYYQSALKRTLNYIEDNLTENFTLDDLVKVHGFSKWHFSRMFHLLTGYAISEYIRNRRLTQASISLLESDERILDLALDYRFSSQESFTRSFKKLAGVTPGEYRKKGVCLHMMPSLKAENLIWTKGDVEVKPEIVNFEPIYVIGMMYEGKNLNGEIGDLWQTFIGRMDEIDALDKGSYGICEPLVEDVKDLDLDNPNDFKYLAGLAVNENAKVPKGMVKWKVDHPLYAAFTHLGDVEEMGDTYKSIYTKWLPESGYDAVYAYDFELYGKDFKPGQADSKCYIYVPVRKRKK